MAIISSAMQADFYEQDIVHYSDATAGLRRENVQHKLKLMRLRIRDAFFPGVKQNRKHEILKNVHIQTSKWTLNHNGLVHYSILYKRAPTFHRVPFFLTLLFRPKTTNTINGSIIVSTKFVFTTAALEYSHEIDENDIRL